MYSRDARKNPPEQRSSRISTSKRLLSMAIEDTRAITADAHPPKVSTHADRGQP